MPRAETVNTPWLGGWILGAAAGLVAVGVLIVVGKFDPTPAVVIGSVVALVAGMILGLPWGAGDAARPGLARASATASAPAVAAMPAAFVAAPAAVTASGGPEQLAAPRGGKADNLKEIEGIGPAMEKLVNEMGFYHFSQIASWSDADVAWVDANMTSFKGRIVRDRWVVQAKLIETEGLEAFRERAKTNNY